MKTKKTILILVILILAFSMVATSCKKTITITESEDNVESNSTGESNVSTSSNLTSNANSISESIVSTTQSNVATSTTNSGTTSSRNSMSRPNQKIIDRSITIKSGTKKMDENLNFGGKAGKLLIWPNIYNDEIKQTVVDYNTKFNAKIAVETVPFEQMRNKLALAVSSGKPYDISYMHGSFYPDVALKSLLEPLQNTITTADYYSDSNIDAGGVDISKSKYFAWGGNLYAVSGYKDASLMVLFYNKLKFSDAGLEDPYTLYKNGKWTWSKFKEMGARVTDVSNNIYFGDNSLAWGTTFQSNGGHLIKVIDGKLSSNFDSPEMIAGMKLTQEMAYGTSKILKPDGAQSEPANFLTGKTFVWVGEVFSYKTYFEGKVNTNSNFGKSYANLGTVPIPYGPDNKTKENPGGWINGISASRGASDPRMAAAYAIYLTKYNKSTGLEFTSDVKSTIDSLYKNVNYMDYGFRDSSDDIINLMFGMVSKIITGSDVTSTLKSYTNKVQGLIDLSLNAQ